jgi:hypothetical protein
LPSLQITTNPQHRGYRINTAHEGAVSQWMDKIIDLSAHALEVQYEPTGYVISFELCPGKTIKQFQEALTYYYRDSAKRTKTPCKPLWATKYEEKELTSDSPEYSNANDPTRVYAHYHMAVILDAKKARDKSLQYFLFKCQEGLVVNYKLSQNQYSGRYSKYLNTEMDDWIYHASYLAKVATTADVRKPFNTVRFH